MFGIVRLFCREVAVSLLRAFEASLQAFEKHRQLVLAPQKRAER